LGFIFYNNIHKLGADSAHCKRIEIRHGKQTGKFINTVAVHTAINARCNSTRYNSYKKSKEVKKEIN
jgi:hypothetical protein